VKSATQTVITIALISATLFTGIGASAENGVSSESARSSPEWVRKAVIYEVFTRNFSQEGTFDGVASKLDDLDELGIDVIWLMPIHPIGELKKKGTIGSPYAVQDYLAVNPNFGTLEDFKQLVQEAHQREMKVIIDIVANHTAWDSVLMAHPEYFKHDDSGKIIPPDPGWADVAALNYENAELRRYMIDMLKYWVQETGVDGFRCDVAYMVPFSFWEQAREELQALNSDILMLAEASDPQLLVQAFDLDYSWPLHATLNDVLLHGAPASTLQKTWEESRTRFPKGALHLRISDNHDEARAVARFGIRGALAAQVLMLTLDGVPLFYNGMEVGDATESGAPALFERLPVYWEPKERPPLRDIYRDLINLRRQNPAFTNSEVIWLENSRSNDVVTFLRRDVDNEFLVIINFSNRPTDASIQIKNPTGFRPLQVAGMSVANSESLPQFTLKPFEWRIYQRGLQN